MHRLHSAFTYRTVTEMRNCSGKDYENSGLSVYYKALSENAEAPATFACVKESFA